MIDGLVLIFNYISMSGERYEGGLPVEKGNRKNVYLSENLKTLGSVDVLRAKMVSGDFDDSRVENGDLLRNKTMADELLLLARSAGKAELEKLMYLFQKVEEYKKSGPFLKLVNEAEENQQEMGSESSKAIAEHIGDYVSSLFKTYQKDPQDREMFRMFPSSSPRSTPEQSLGAPLRNDFNASYVVSLSDEENVRRNELIRIMKILLYGGGPFYPSEIEGKDKEGCGNPVFDRFVSFERKMVKENPLNGSELQKILSETNK